MLRRARMLSVLAMLVAGGLGVVSSTQTWLHVTLRGAETSDVAVSGAAAIAVLTPMSLAALALGAALSLVGRWLRVVLGVVAVGIAGWMLVLNGALLGGRPVAAVAGTVSTKTGVSGEQSIEALVDTVTPTAWPALTMAAWVLLAVAGVFVVVTAGRWRAGGRRYAAETDDSERGRRARATASAGGTLDAIDSWDDLNRGDDPTTPSDDDADPHRVGPTPA